MAFMRTNTGTPNLQMSPMLPLLLMNSGLSTDNDIVMMALLIDQLGNNQTQDRFSTNRFEVLKIRLGNRRKTVKDEYDVAITAA